jgi:hypothetical protein
MYRTSYRSIPTSRGPSYLPTSWTILLTYIVDDPSYLHPAHDPFFRSSSNTAFFSRQCWGHSYSRQCSGHSYSRQCSGHSYSRQCWGHLWKSVGLRQRPALIVAALGGDFGRVRALIFGWIGPRFWPSFLEFVRSSICRYIGVFWIWGVGSDPFLDHFGPRFRPYFPALENLTMLPAAQKIVGRYFAHREQECPSAKGSFSQKVNKARKAGIQSPAIPFSRRVLPSFWPASACLWCTQ